MGSKSFCVVPDRTKYAPDVHVHVHTHAHGRPDELLMRSFPLIIFSIRASAPAISQRSRCLWDPGPRLLLGRWLLIPGSPRSHARARARRHPDANGSAAKARRCFGSPGRTSHQSWCSPTKLGTQRLDHSLEETGRQVKCNHGNSQVRAFTIHYRCVCVFPCPDQSVSNSHTLTGWSVSEG